MRWLATLLPLAVALALPLAPPAQARPEFARRESKACGFCHINPAGGGPRNQTGLRYARNEFKFTVRPSGLADFKVPAQRAAMAHVGKLLDHAHVREAVVQLKRLRRADREEKARALVADRLHALDVKGTEILGRARRLLRGSDAEEGVTLLVMLTLEYKDLDVHAEATRDLKDRGKEQPELRDRIRAEKREGKARLAYLDGVRLNLEGKPEKATRAFAKVVKGFPGTRAAELASARLPKPSTD